MRDETIAVRSTFSELEREFVVDIVYSYSHCSCIHLARTLL